MRRSPLLWVPGVEPSLRFCLVNRCSWPSDSLLEPLTQAQLARHIQLEAQGLRTSPRSSYETTRSTLSGDEVSSKVRARATRVRLGRLYQRQSDTALGQAR